ncbi:hypothetical protein NM688_g8322 [Phlebia brevispora]|uniref:Uncharacterized protein n=1 Tax=Phlebia brevispora TaxID=194682 RepID=A0ACC1RSM2_9APHY|nr:hypothetical protein NM688_g8322 [Phlebia brevispora]
MALLSSPRKQTVPLATGDEKPSLWKRTAQPPFTKRVFFCSVVVENPEDGSEFPPDLQDFVAQFGDPLDLDDDLAGPNSSTASISDTSQYGNEPYTRKRLPSAPAPPPSFNDPSRPDQSIVPLAVPNPSSRSVALADVINELVATERSYVKRLRILRDEYAKPLREYSRTKDTLIIPPYEAKVLFGNIDQLLPVNEAFLEDLETMLVPDGQQLVGGVGDVALKHFKDLKGFECYRQYYAKREEAQSIFEKEIRKGGQLATFIDRIKYATADARNRVGLRELLMEPVQRIPRYTLLFREMVKQMDAADPQRPKLVEADEHASRIAQAVPDEQTKRAAMWYCFSTTIEDFPANLVSNSRKFIDCIDVDDVLMHDRFSEAVDVTPGGTVGGILHCSLLLFDDKLVILKRPSSERGVRALTGLEELEKSTKAQPFAPGLKKSGIQYKGTVDLTEVVSTDIGGADLHVFLEVPPINDSERWSGRPFRAYSVVHPPSPVNLDPRRSEADKKRFLDNLWTAQARYRTRSGQSVVVATEEQQVESQKGRLQIAKTYFNIYQRTAFLQEQKKTKIVVQIDPLGSADPIPFGVQGPPYVLIRVQPIEGELCRYSVTYHNPNESSSDDDNHGEEDIVQLSRVPERIVQTSNSYVWAVQLPHRQSLGARHAYCQCPLEGGDIRPRRDIA